MKLLILICVFLVGCNRLTNCHPETSHIKAIGGCDHWEGSCRVILENEETFFIIYPVVGMLVNYNKCDNGTYR